MVMERKNLSLQEAKDISLEVWKYLSEYVELDSKRDLPSDLYAKVEHLLGECPLCHCFSQDCQRCPIDKAMQNCFETDSAYHIWLNVDALYSNEERKKSATLIYDIIRGWDINKEIEGK